MVLSIFSCVYLPPTAPLNLFFFIFYFLLFFILFIYFLFMAVLGLRFCARAFSSCGKRGPLFIAVRGPLTIAASLVAEHRLQMRRLSNCGSRAQLLRGMRDAGSSQTRARTHVPCIGRQTPNHCATREAPAPLNLYSRLDFTRPPSCRVMTSTFKFLEYFHQRATR